MAATKLTPGTYGYDGPTTGAHYCGSGGGCRYAVWSIEPTDTTCVDCGEGFRAGAAAVKLVTVPSRQAAAIPHGVLGQRMATEAARKVTDVHHVRCVDWAAWYVAWDRRISSSDPLVKTKRTATERDGIFGLLDSPTRVTLADHWRSAISPNTAPCLVEAEVKRDLGMTLDQLAFFIERSDALAAA